DHAALRRVIASGYRDAAADRGAGLAPTWPFQGWWAPWVTIDHVLVDRRVEVAACATRVLHGSDHRAVLAELLLPATPDHDPATPDPPPATQPRKPGAPPAEQGRSTKVGGTATRSADRFTRMARPGPTAPSTATGGAAGAATAEAAIDG